MVTAWQLLGSKVRDLSRYSFAGKREQNPRDFSLCRRSNFIPALPFCHVELKAPKTKRYDALTLGEHIKKCRLERNLTQSNAAAFLSVSVETLHNWEAGKTLAAIMEFLGYCPYQQSRTLGDRLRLHRMHRGLTFEEFAEELGVDPGSIARWERGGREPQRKYRDLVEDFVRCPL